MRVEHFPWDYRLSERFPSSRGLYGYEGGWVATAERDGKFYIAVDEGTMGEFLDPDDPTDAEVLARLITVMEFDTQEERDEYAQQMLDEHQAAMARMRDSGDDNWEDDEDEDEDTDEE